MHSLLIHSRGGQYYHRIKGMFGSSIIGYWPLWEPSGNPVVDISGNDHHGVYGTGIHAPSLGQTGIGDGKTCASFDGGDFANIYSAGLAAAFTPNSGSLLMWAKVADVGVWTDATIRRLFNLTADGNNFYLLSRSSANNILQATFRRGGATSINIGLTSSATGWLHLALTWNSAANEYKYFSNATQVGTTQTTAGVWSGSLAASTTTIGATNITPSNPWNGSIAHVLLLNRPATPTELTGVVNI